METTTQNYAIAFGGACFALFLANSRRLVRLLAYALRLLSRFSYIRVIRRFKRDIGRWHLNIGPWHLHTVLLLALFLGVNAYLILFNGFFKLVSVEETSIRAANLSLINLVPVMAGPSQSRLASTVFGVSLKTFQKVHRSLALVSTLLVALHIAAAIVARGAFPLQVVSNVWAVAVSR